ncbi:MFS transporter [Paenibacillus sp. UNC499MF]|uniref:MFS transporter n=1 Tax=Paenibacillus sp. UNC499MF TaxID=1502751 RepID=UPI00089FF0DB|nr:MFS transporter [Paenibacillus sp. UNC499MF]SEF91725.1 Predicted arabinose efflux permease, MFS family [Paenibacillus sp. UNC499MF]
MVIPCKIGRPSDPETGASAPKEAPAITDGEASAPVTADTETLARVETPAPKPLPVSDLSTAPKPAPEAVLPAALQPAASLSPVPVPGLPPEEEAPPASHLAPLPEPAAPSSSLSPAKALLFSAACGLAVANIYYAQPLLDALAAEFGVAPAAIGLVVTVTQLCYALGLLLLVPLGDLLNRRRLIAVQMLLSAGALLIVGTAPSAPMLLAGMAAVGLLAVVTQVLVAYASTLASPAERGRLVGIVQSGIVIGILLARTFAGTLTDLAGWRSVYLISGLLMLVTGAVLFRVLPDVSHKKTALSYPRLLRSVFTLFKEERLLRVRAVLAFLIFTAFSTLWTALVLPLSAPPLSLSHTAVGAFGLAGAAGALAAAGAGRLADRGLGQRTTGMALVLLLASWGFIGFTPHSLTAAVVGVILLDLAVQAVHVTNQSLIFTVRPEARSRLTAGYMMFYSLGSATGAIASTSLYAVSGWSGVCLFGAAVSGLALLFWALTLRRGPK